MKRLFLDFLRDESGQTSTEYILILVIVVALVSKLGKTMTGRLGDMVDKVFDNPNLNSLLEGNVE